MTATDLLQEAAAAVDGQVVATVTLQVEATTVVAGEEAGVPMLKTWPTGGKGQMDLRNRKTAISLNSTPNNSPYKH